MSHAATRICNLEDLLEHPVWRHGRVSVSVLQVPSIGYGPQEDEAIGASRWILP
jgi:hypothetical protein